MRKLSLEQRVDRIETRIALAELGTTYAIACDERDMTRLRATFAFDAVVRAVNGTIYARGIRDIMSMYDQMFRARGAAYHWTHDRLIFFDEMDMDRATGQVLGHAEVTIDGTASVVALRYNDVYVRRSGTWLFLERALSFLYYLPVAEYASRLFDQQRVNVGGDYIAADFPERLDTWQHYYGGRARDQ